MFVHCLKMRSSVWWNRASVGRTNTALGWGLILLAVTACSPQQALKDESAASQVQPEETISPNQRWQTGIIALADLDSGLESFQDKRLQGLATEALRHNKSLKQSADNYSASVKATANAVTRLASVLVMEPLDSGRKPRWLKSFSTTSWEADLWQYLGHSKESVAATDGEITAARKSLVLQLARGWFLTLETRQHQELAEESLEIYVKRQAFTERSHQLGMMGSDEVAEAAARRVQAANNLQQILEARESAENALKLLLGRHPSKALSSGAAVPIIRETIPRGLSSATLARRPDLVRAQRHLNLAFSQPGSAKVATLPEIPLSKNAGWPTPELKSLVNSGKAFWQPGTQLLAPGYVATTGEQKQAVSNYARTVYAVYKEARTSLLRDRLLAVQEKEIKAARNRVQKKLSSVRGQYNAGRSDLSAVLQQQEAALNSEMVLLRSGGQRLLQRINLHLALGGTFQN